MEAGFAQVHRIPGNVGTPALSACANPTIGASSVLITAPKPSPCDKVGSPINCTVSPTGQAVNPTGSGGSGGSGGTGSTGGTGGTGTTGGSSGTGGTGSTGSTSTGSAATGTTGTTATSTDPLTGTVTGAGTTLAANSVDVSANRTAASPAFYALGLGELLLVIVVPPVLVTVFRRRRKAQA